MILLIKKFKYYSHIIYFKELWKILIKILILVNIKIFFKFNMQNLFIFKLNINYK